MVNFYALFSSTHKIVNGYIVTKSKTDIKTKVKRNQLVHMIIKPQTESFLKMEIINEQKVSKIE